MKKKKSILKDKEKMILIILHKEGGFMTAHEISKKTEISYVTVQKYLNKMLADEVIVKEDDNKKQKHKV